MLNRLFKKSGIPSSGSMHFVKQSQPGGDGLACIAMVFAFYGIPIGIDTLNKTYSQFSQGMCLRDIMEILNKYGLKERALQCSTKELNNLSMPSILHWNMRQFVVLENIHEGTFTVADPASKRLILSLDEFEQCFGEIVLEIVNEP